ncbi:MAG: MFS transporter [Candidatus Abyssobacteria bacterium SURF_17]|uniref:MFS transporter n=1 Tax=Candidatus Abyssobacteria bacterium SURF_17 TaxID=2093361 RepID=A0A419F3T5_9BACT|nr:MAG: MFS transporter [Candidatus Abyssubacteria bacterium SURF_17]
MSDKIKNYGWTVALAGTGINLALGVLYTWSVISKAIPAEWGWNEAQRALPYSVACIVFALVMVAAGRMQDKIGPRIVATLGGILTGLGFVIASASTSLVLFVIGFGILSGAGIGFGYASATPPAVKWFPSQRTGLIAGIVVAGFGLASVYAAPLARYLIGLYGVQTAMRIFGVGFLVVVVVLSQILRNPPQGYKPIAVAQAKGGQNPGIHSGRDYHWLDMMRTPQFYLLWFMFACGSGAGLMIIGKLAKIVELQSGSKAGFILVALLAIGNAGGRVIAGVLSDKIGRTTTMLIVFCAQAVLMFTLRLQTYLGLLVVYSMLIGFNYGACLSLFPSTTKDYFGIKNFGLNYGLVFTAWGVGGLVLPILSGRIFDATGSFNPAYLIAGFIMIAAAGLTFVTKAPKEEAVVRELKAAA